MKKKKQKRTDPIPFYGWAFVVIMVLYSEVMLHFWVMDELDLGRIAAVIAFALGFGSVLGFVTSLFSWRWSKWVAVGISVVVTVVMLMEYFISDAYRVFMTPSTIISGAGGVAQDYMGLVLSLVLRNLWRVALMLLPVGFYAKFCRSRRPKWPFSAALVLATVFFFALGLSIVRDRTNDMEKLTKAYNFDSAVRSFGLNMGLSLETIHSGKEEEAPSFVAMDAEAPTLPQELEEEQSESAAENVVYGDNVIAALDFAALSKSEFNGKVAALHSYVSTLTPSRQNAYTGLFEGKNLILITAEALTLEAIDPELTPTLYRLANEGIRFEDYYQPAWGASTTSGEFSNVVGLVPTTGGLCMKETTHQDLFLTMGHQLQDLGYYSAAYHNHNKDFYDRHKTHEKLGYDRFIAQYGGLEGVDAVWPESDLQMIQSTVDDYIDQQPFSIYYMTVSGHCVYSENGNAQGRKHIDKVAHLPYSETVRYYLASQLELEYAMEELVRQLEEKGIADDTVIVMATDHYPYGLERSGTWKNTSDYLKELFGVESYDNFVRDHNALIIWSGCLEDMDIVVEDPVYSLDILPTLSNLFGVEYDSRLLVGRDVFSDAEPIVLWPDYSWKTDKGSYSIKTGEFVPQPGAKIPAGYVEYINSLVANKITYSDSVLKLDYFNYLAKALGR